MKSTEKAKAADISSSSRSEHDWSLLAAYVSILGFPLEFEYRGNFQQQVIFQKQWAIVSLIVLWKFLWGRQGFDGGVQSCGGERESPTTKGNHTIPW